MVHADGVFGSQDIKLKKFSDVAGVVRMKDREPMRKVLENFEAKFPQLFVSVYLGAFEDLNSLRQYGFWMLNRTNYVDVDAQRPNSTGILILVDVNAKSASITFGYALMPYLDENSTFEALSSGHPFFLQGDYLKALKAVIEKLEIPLVRGWRRVRKNPIEVLARGGQTLKGYGSGQKKTGASEPSSGKVGRGEG
jgi:hypothetical protein